MKYPEECKKTTNDYAKKYKKDREDKKKEDIINRKKRIFHNNIEIYYKK